MKGFSPLVSMVLVIAFGFAAMTIVLTVVNPLLDRARDAGVVNEATQNMQLLDSAIRAVGSEAQGSKRTIHIKITEGALRTNSIEDWVYIDFDPKTGTVLDGFSGDVKIESKPVFLEYFNWYGENDNANETWTSLNGTWTTSSGRLQGTGGIAYHNLGRQSGFELAATVVASSAPDGQVYVIPGNPENLVLYLPFDGNVNTSVTTAYDYSAYKNNGTLVNSTSATCFTNNACPSWVTGRFGNATEYDGLGDYVNVTYSGSLNITGAVTVSAWVKKNTNPTTNRGIVGRWWNFGSETNSRSFDLLEQSNSVPLFSVNPTGSGTSNTSVGTTTLQTGQWYHLVGVFEPSTAVRIYVNGVLDGSTTSNIMSSTFGSDKPVRIGVTFDPTVSSRIFNGTIDEVMIFNRALSADEVAFLYESSAEKVTTSGEIPTIGEDANVTIVLASPGSSYFDNVKLKSGAPKIRFVVPYQNIDIVNQTRFGPGDHNIVIVNYGINATNNRKMIGIEE